MTEITILNLLDKRPMYGAEMVEEIKKLSGNTVIMSLPTLYSSLHRMATKKLVNSYQKQSTIGGRCRVYNITKFGREYLSKNPININYNTIANDIAEQMAINATPANKTFETLEDAFSLPLSKNPLPEEIVEEKRVLTITPPPEPAPAQTAKTTRKNSPQISPYISLNEKITTTPEPEYKQILIGLSGTVGGNDLRPLVKLNDVKVGNDYVVINRLRMAAAFINTMFFILINFLFSLTRAVQPEIYNLIYIILSLYVLINLAIYIVYPRIKTAYNKKTSRIYHIVTSLVLFILVLTYCFVAGTPQYLWVVTFTLLPVIELVLILVLRNKRWFTC